MWDRVPRIEVVGGRHGFLNVANSNRVPLGGLVVCRNMSLAAFSWRTGGGAAKLGDAITAAPKILHAIDYWPTPNQQRTVVVANNGRIYKDDGSGRNWTSLTSGLVQGTGEVPHFCIVGAEAPGEPRKLVYMDRVSGPLVLVGDAAALTAITRPAADWTGRNQPAWCLAHQGYNWAGGNLNAPHTLYRSLAIDHQDFLTVPYTLICGPESHEQYTVGGVSYKGGIVVGKFPVGTYFVDTSTDLDPLKWTAQLVASPGWAGGHAGAVVEDDVVWMAPDGSWHSLTAALGVQKASIRASSLSYRKLTSWPSQNMNLALVADTDFLYYADGQELIMSYAATGSLDLDHRLHLDLNNKAEVGDNWVIWDRDLNASLFLRQLAGGRSIPAFGDDAGQIWLLDQDVRTKDGAAYTSEFMLVDTDFAMLFRNWMGRKKNGRFLQLEYLSNTEIPLTLDIYLDGVKTQTMALTLAASGVVLPKVTPFETGLAPLKLTAIQRLLGQFTRLAIRGQWATAGADVHVTRLIIGCELAA